MFYKQLFQDPGGSLFQGRLTRGQLVGPATIPTTEAGLWPLPLLIISVFYYTLFLSLASSSISLSNSPGVMIISKGNGPLVTMPFSSHS